MLAATLAAGGCSSPTGPGVTPPPIEPPTVSCPDPQTLTAPNGIALSFSFETPIAAKGTPPVTTACSPPSGSSFPVGETTVTCTATDAVQRAAACTFLVTVKAPPHLLLTRFVAFGDSITWGEDGTNPPTTLTMPGWVHQNVRIPQSQQYPDVLQQELAARYTLQTPQVANEGKQGEEARDPATPPRFSSKLSGRDVVLLMEGSNDVDEQDATILPASIANLRQMLDEAKRRGLRPYLATIPPQNPNGCCPRRGVGAGLVPGFNDQIRSLAASENVPLVDIYQALNTDVGTFIGFDGLHPTVAGYARMADVFFASIMQTLEGPGAITVQAPGIVVATPRIPVRGSKPPGVRPASSGARIESRP